MALRYLFNYEGDLAPFHDEINLNALNKAILNKVPVYCEDGKVRVVTGIYAKKCHTRNVLELLFGFPWTGRPRFSAPMREYTLEELRAVVAECFRSRPNLGRVSAARLSRKLQACSTFHDVLRLIEDPYANPSSEESAT